MRKSWVLIAVAIAFSCFIYRVLPTSIHPDAGPIITVRASSIPNRAILPKDTLVIAGVGDVMMGTNYPAPGMLPPEEGRTLFADVASELRTADITMGNLEGVLLDKGGIAKSCRDPKVCYVFRSPVKYASNLVDAGFDIMSIANNHAGDFGAVGTQSTMTTLETVGLYYAGQSSKPSITFERDGVRYGFAAFAPNTGCLNLNDLAGARKIVQHLDSTCDVVIVSFHGGAEGPAHQHVTRSNEVFYGENRGNVHLFAHTVVDAGADIVFGHGPHVVRAVEVYKNRFIAYSLGNFCTYGGINVNGINGYAPIIKVWTDTHGAFRQGKITACIQNFLTPVALDPQKLAIRKMQELTRADFPQGMVTIDDDGWIRNSTN